MLWGAFNNASSAMQAYSKGMSTISQNIANMNTVGYKGADTTFKTVMSESVVTSGGGSTDIFGVKAAGRNLINVQGMLQASSKPSDIAINGEGFFVVATPTANGANTDLNDPNAVFFTRDGSLRTVAGPNNEAFYTNSSGMYVLGWMADQQGVVDTSKPLSRVWSTPETSMTGLSTTHANLIGNLPMSINATGLSQVTKTSVNDPAGDSKLMNLNWSRANEHTNVWTVTASIENGTIADNVFDVTLDVWGNVLSPSSSDMNLNIDWDDGIYGGAANTDKLISLTSMAPVMSMQKTNLEVYDNNRVGHTLELGFEKAANNKWNAYVSGEGIAAPVGPIALEFSANGKLITQMPVDVALNWDDGGAANFALDLSSMTQFAGDKMFINSRNQNGYTDGKMTDTQFTKDGRLVGTFTNGEVRTIFQLGIANFVSDNMLDNVNGNLFRRTAAAGEMVITDVTNSPGGTSITANTLEASTVDIGEEFTKMIVTQKAYTHNATVFRTADEMASAARDLKA